MFLKSILDIWYQVVMLCINLYFKDYFTFQLAWYIQKPCKDLHDLLHTMADSKVMAKDLVLKTPWWVRGCLIFWGTYRKMKNWKFPLYFKSFPLCCHVYKKVQLCKGCTHLNGNFLVWLQFISVSHIQYFLAQRNKQLFNFTARLNHNIGPVPEYRACTRV